MTGSGSPLSSARSQTLRELASVRGPCSISASRRTALEETQKRPLHAYHIGSWTSACPAVVASVFITGPRSPMRVQDVKNHCRLSVCIKRVIVGESRLLPAVIFLAIRLALYRAPCTLPTRPRAARTQCRHMAPASHPCCPARLSQAD